MEDEIDAKAKAQDPKPGVVEIRNERKRRSPFL